MVQVGSVEKTDQSFSECLNELLTNHLQEWKEIGEDLYVRLEQMKKEGDFIKGEFSRKQTVNIPPKAKASHQALVPNPDHLAHRAAFQFHPKLGIIAIEANRNGMSLGKIDSLIREVCNGHSGFTYMPVPMESAWGRFNECEPRKFTVKVANPQNLGVVDGQTNTLIGNLRSMKDLMNGPVIEVTVGFGHSEGSLNKNKVTSIIKGFLKLQNMGGEVEKLQIKGEGEEEVIDFLVEQIKASEKLDLNDQDLSDHYSKRKQFIERVFKEHLASLNRIYSKAA